MKVSVVTVCYNSAETVEATIQSVLGQDYPNIEYILIDGMSKDHTLSIIKKYEHQLATIVSEPDKGIYDAINKGVGMATGDVISVLNSDDVFAHTEVVSRMVEVLERNGADAGYADLNYVKRDNLDEVVRYWKSGQYKQGKFLKGWMPPHPTFFVKRWCYEHYGRFHLNLKSSADYELMLRFIHKHRIKLAYLPEVTVHMRTGGTSNVSLKNRLRGNREDHMAWEMNGLKPGAFTLIRKPLSKIVQYLRRP
jgi:glycosyltransferase involved in cell wall biosynthesis